MIYSVVCGATKQIKVGKESQRMKEMEQHYSKSIAVVSIGQSVFNLNNTGYILFKTGVKTKIDY